MSVTTRAPARQLTGNRLLPAARQPTSYFLVGPLLMAVAACRPSEVPAPPPPTETVLPQAPQANGPPPPPPLRKPPP